MNKLFIPIIFSILLFSLTFPASAQTAGGTISGTITDSNGAAVAGADIVITNQGTGVNRTLKTNESGIFSSPSLLPGNYSILVTANGFTRSQKNLELNVGAESTVDFQLKVGDVSSSITVEAAPSQIEQISSTMSATVEGKTVRELPLNGRDWTQLATLEPTVHAIDTQNPPALANTARANRGFGTQLTVGGARPQQNNYRLDGISINDYSGGGPGNTLGAVLGVEAIQEFSVVSANPSGEYGKTSGGVFNAITRSGVNQFHGSAFEFHRDSKFDARNYFDGATKPPFKRNQFGVALGGPVYFLNFGEGVPALYHGKDKTFFFFDYEGLRENLSNTNLIIVPTARARTGDLGPIGPTGDVVVNTRVASFLQFYPLPNVSETGDTGVASLVQKNVTDENFFTARFDHNASEKDILHGTFFVDNGRTVGPDSFNLSQLGSKSRRRMYSFEETHIFRPALVNTFRIGLSRVIALSPEVQGLLDKRADDPAFAFVPNGKLGSIIVSGLTLFPGVRSQEARIFQNSYQAYDDVFLTKGSHSFKFGLAYEYVKFDFLTTSGINGQFQFTSLSNFLTNKPSNFQAQDQSVGIQPVRLRQSIFGVYAQDDWRVRQNLTLNLGLRYETVSVPTEVDNRIATLANLTDATLKIGSPYFNNPTRLNFSPRVGLAWDPFGKGKTSVRAAFGLYDTLPLTYQFEGLNLNSAPFSRLGVTTNTTALVNTFPNTALGLLTPETLRVSYIEQNPKRSYVMQWNLTAQHEIVKNVTAQIGYVGSRGVHQPYRTQDADIVLPTVGADGSLIFPLPVRTGTRLNTKVGQINALAWEGNNFYHAMNAKVTRKMKGGQIGLAYTWAKSIDNNSASVIGGQFANSINGLPLSYTNLWRGLSDFDVRHSLSINSVMEIPLPKSGSSVVNIVSQGWQLGGIYRYQTGHPFSVTIAGDSLGMRSNNSFNFPDRVAGCNNTTTGNPNAFINAACFTVATPTNRLGNAGRNTLTGPNLSNFDISLVKNTHITKISEAFNIQLRLEAFNVLNHANFRAPTGVSGQLYTVAFAANSAAGKLLSTATTSRQIQLGLKLVW